MKYIIIFLSYLSLDVVWFKVFTSKIFDYELRNSIGRGVQFSVLPALVVYALLALGFLYFVVPKFESGALYKNMFYSGLYGLVVYGVYDFTNKAIISSWSPKFIALDVFWGIVSSILVFAILSFFYQ